jgi:hypothetical protein
MLDGWPSNIVDWEMGRNLDLNLGGGCKGVQQVQRVYGVNKPY